MSNAIYAEKNPQMKPIGGKASKNRFYDPAKIKRHEAEKYIVSGGATSCAPHYTSSIDCALTLVPDGWTEYDQMNRNGYHEATFNNHEAKRTAWGHSDASQAIAICIAALKARNA